MKRLIVCLGIIAGLTVITAFSIDRVRHPNMNVPINVKGISEHNLQIISPSDPQFDVELASLLKDRDSYISSVNDLRPFCAFIRNESEQDVLFYGIKWEITNPDGKVSPFGYSSGAPGPFIGLESREGAASGPRDGVIKAKSSLFVAMDLDFKNLVLMANRMSAEQAQLNLQNYLTSNRAKYDELLASASTITVSLDGAALSDGSFVGDDTRNLYQQLQQLIKARQDILATVERGVAERQSPGAILSKLQADAERSGRENEGASGANYGYFFKTYVDELHQIKATRGDEASVNYARGASKKLWKPLHKKGERIG